MDEPVLELRGIYKHFGGVTALADVHFKVMPGEVVGLIGDNGAGKSTLVKTMSGLLMPDAGEIYSRGNRVRMHSVHDAAELGVQTVYQDLALCDNLNPVQNLFLGQEMRGPWFLGGRLKKAAMETRARAVLGELGVKVRNIETHVGWMSGGQRQGIAVCRSILRDPAAVILDEPTAALGVAQRAEVLELIKRLRDQGRGVVLVSHDLGDVEKIADRVVALRLGRVVAEMATGEFTHEAMVSAITGGMALAGQPGHARYEGSAP